MALQPRRLQGMPNIKRAQLHRRFSNTWYHMGSTGRCVPVYICTKGNSYCGHKTHDPFDRLITLRPARIACTSSDHIQNRTPRTVAFKARLGRVRATKPATRLEQMSLGSLSTLAVPRYCQQPNACNLQIHGFCDASIRAYGCSLYLRTEGTDGNIAVHLLTSKSRLAPVKKQSLPKLELCGTHLLAQLYNKGTSLRRPLGSRCKERKGSS
ncbi:uncharacterized protein LOC118750312 [Rhagoletis pomonella]|uniref:uncharacterized protein LOC118750312 n=1 Tax=Rhagoletis pomonella TaxID=28610 RepID=UPI00177E7389|nr:uncharacterized protein LOC118750312 [Rhagoletis pomonella]